MGIVSGNFREYGGFMKNYLKNLLLVSGCFFSLQLNSMVPQAPRVTAKLDTRDADLRAAALKVQLDNLKVRNLIAAINQDNLSGVRCYLAGIENLKNKNLELVQAAIAQLYTRVFEHKATDEQELVRTQILDLLQTKFPGIDPEEYRPLHGTTADSTVMAAFTAAHNNFFEAELDKFILAEDGLTDSKEAVATGIGLVDRSLIGRSLLTPERTLTPRLHEAHAVVDSPRCCDSALELLTKDARGISCSPTVSRASTPKTVTSGTPS